MAPFAPFFSESIWQKLKNDGDEESVHLSMWPTPVESGKWKVESTIEEMKKVRELCTSGNALRKKENIAVKQPLKTFVINYQGLENYYDLIKDELNVKNIEVGNELILDTQINAELKQEGDYRELVRMIQDLRKEKGLAPNDVISLTLPEKYQEIFDAFGEDMKKTVGAKEIIVSGDEININ